MVGATTLSLFTVCQQLEQVGTILIIDYSWQNLSPALRPWAAMKRRSGGFETFERSFKTSGNVKGRRAWVVVWLLQIHCWDDLCEGACGGGQGQGAGFSGRMSLWLLADKMFAFLFSKWRRKLSTLWFMVKWAFSHLWASENSGAAGCFQKSLSTSKAREVGCLSIFQTAWPWRKWGNVQLYPTLQDQS